MNVAKSAQLIYMAKQAKKPPCYNGGNDCDKRSPGCHSTCKEYIAWSAEQKELGRKLYIKNKALGDLDRTAIERSQRAKKSAKNWRNHK